MKLYSVSDNYINYLRNFDDKVYDNKETNRKNTRKYLGINYKILIEKELEFIKKNSQLIHKYAKIIYNQKTNNHSVSYLKSVVDFKLLESKCIDYINSH